MTQKLLPNPGRKILLSAEEMISHYIPKDQKFVNEMVSIYSTLLSFSFEKGMIKISPFDNQGKLIMHYSVYEKDLTEIGKLYFETLVYKWLAYTDRSKKNDNFKILEKWYSQMSQ